MKYNQDHDYKNRLWEHGLHEDNVFNNRLNFFLVFESLLLAVVAMLYNKTETNGNIILILILLGISITVVWILVQAKQKYILDLLKTRIRDHFKDYEKLIESRNKKKLSFSITWLLTYVIPVLIIFVWITLLISIT